MENANDNTPYFTSSYFFVSIGEGGSGEGVGGGDESVGGSEVEVMKVWVGDEGVGGVMKVWVGVRWE